MIKEKLGSNATFTGAGKGLNYYTTKKGVFVGATSGNILLTTAYQTFLEFTTGTEVTIADVEYGLDWNLAATAYISLKIEMNGTTVWFDNVRRDVTRTANRGEPSFVIPPLTTFTVSMLSTDANSIPTTVTMTGRVYA